MLDTYYWSIWGIWCVVVLIIIQSIIAAIAHRTQPHYIPGKISETLSHDSFVFRSYRTFHNSLENGLIFFVPAIIALLVGVDSSTMTISIWVYLLARLIHMLLYYFIATEKNPSPRSYFYGIGLVANFMLIINIANVLISH